MTARKNDLIRLLYVVVEQTGLTKRQLLIHLSEQYKTDWPTAFVVQAGSRAQAIGLIQEAIAQDPVSEFDY